MNSSVETNFREYLSMYDGKPKELGEHEIKLVDTVFEDVIVVGDSGATTITKSALLQRIESYLKAGRKIAILELACDDNADTMAWKVQITGPWTGPFGINKIERTRATIKDGKICQIKQLYDLPKGKHKGAKPNFAIKANEQANLLNA